MEEEFERDLDPILGAGGEPGDRVGDHPATESPVGVDETSPISRRAGACAVPNVDTLAFVESLGDHIQRKASRLGLEFEARFYGAALERQPDSPDVLAVLGEALTSLGRYEEGLEADQALVKLVPENGTVRYNLACSLALCGRSEEALDELEHAVECGYDEVGHMVADEDLVSLREEPRFKALVKVLKGE